MKLRAVGNRFRAFAHGPISVDLDSDFGKITEYGLTAFAPDLELMKKESAPSDFPWYPYGTMSNLRILDGVLSGENRTLRALAPGLVVADIIDHGPTNFNGLRGARQLKEALGSSVEIHDIDLDAKFQLPRDDYDLVIFLGILYHLKNPYYALEALARFTQRCLVSTRIARFAGPDRTLRSRTSWANTSATTTRPTTGSSPRPGCASCSPGPAGRSSTSSPSVTRHPSSRRRWTATSAPSAS